MPLPCFTQCLTCCIHVPSQVYTLRTLVPPSALHAAFTSPVKCVLHAAPLSHPAHSMLHSPSQSSVYSMPLPCFTQFVTCCMPLPSQVCSPCHSLVQSSVLHAAFTSPVKCVLHTNPLFNPVQYLLHSPPQSRVYSMPLPCVIQCLTCCIHLPSQVGTPCHSLVSPSALHAAFTSPVKCILYAPLFHPVRYMLHSPPQSSVYSMPLPCITQYSVEVRCREVVPRGLRETQISKGPVKEHTYSQARLTGARGPIPHFP